MKLPVLGLLLLAAATPLAATYRPPLTRQFFRETNSQLSPEDFESKWETSVSDSPLALLRSFVATYYADLKGLPQLGPIGICFGDLHAENFSFIALKTGPDYLFSDFDDSGYCPIALDALRYFVAMDLNDERKQTSKLIRAYVEAIQNNDSAITISADKIPDLEKKRKKNLEKYTNEDADEFITDEADGTKDLTVVPPKLKKEITSAVASSIPNLEILDIAAYTKESGGSGGLTRYWLLVSNSRSKDILELKPEPTPGTSLGGWQPNPSPRIDWIVSEIWQDSPHVYYTGLSLFGAEYLLRSRSYQNVDVDGMSGAERLYWRKVQIKLMAKQHRKYLESSQVRSLQWLEDFLLTHTAEEADRFRAVLTNLR